MARKAVRAASEARIEGGALVLGGTLKREVGTFKPIVTGLVREYSKWKDSASKHAAGLIGLFNRIKGALAGDRENPVDFTLRDFAALYDPNVPLHPREKNGVQGYQANPTYAAIAALVAANRAKNRPKGQQGVRQAATDEMARLCASLLSIPGMPPALFWSALQAQSQMEDRTVKRLQTRVAKTKPLIDMSKIIKRPVQVTAAAIVDMPRAVGSEHAAEKEARNRNVMQAIHERLTAKTGGRVAATA